ncbi:MAG: hypothetical protein E7632_02285 [Ruminococcaceae bacterium]|nr:hypothetical protein [Oscillospiraceae bacterium]
MENITYLFFDRFRQSVGFCQMGTNFAWESERRIKDERSILNDSERSEAYIKELRSKADALQWDALSDRELLAALLSFAVDAEHAEQLADELLCRFGTFRTVFKADHHTLGKIPGMPENAVRLLLLAACVIYGERPREQIHYGEQVESIPKLFEREIDGSPNEELWAAGYDEHGMLCACECIARGEIDHVTTSVSAVADFCVSHRIHVVALAHNHPMQGSGISAEDRKSAQLLYGLLSDFDIYLRWFVVLSDTTETIAFDPPRQYFSRDCQ